MGTAILGRYPQKFLDILQRENVMFDLTEEDKALIAKNTVDILGMNYYQPMRVKAKETPWDDSQPFHPNKYFDNYDMPARLQNPYLRLGDLSPQPVRHRDAPSSANTTTSTGSSANRAWACRTRNSIKTRRASFRIPTALSSLPSIWPGCPRRLRRGCNCHGYWLFASIDNCSPYNTFKNRYGLVEVDRKQNLKRRLKASADWYRCRRREQ